MNSVGTLKIVHIKKNLKKKKKERKPSCIPIRLCIHISISFVQQCHYFSLSTLIKKKKSLYPLMSVGPHRPKEIVMVIPFYRNTWSLRTMAKDPKLVKGEVSSQEQVGDLEMSFLLYADYLITQIKCVEVIRGHLNIVLHFLLPHSLPT